MEISQRDHWYENSSAQPLHRRLSLNTAHCWAHASLRIIAWAVVPTRPQYVLETTLNLLITTLTLKGLSRKKSPTLYVYVRKLYFFQNVFTILIHYQQEQHPSLCHILCRIAWRRPLSRMSEDDLGLVSVNFSSIQFHVGTIAQAPSLWEEGCAQLQRKQAGVTMMLGTQDHAWTLLKYSWQQASFFIFHVRNILWNLTKK